VGLKRVLDTNAVLYLLGGLLDESLPVGEYLVSVATRMELFSYPGLDPEGETRIRAFLSDVEVVGLSEQVADAAIRRRREYGLKLPDVIIAATALTADAELLTNDDKLSRVRGISCRRLKLRQP